MENIGIGVHKNESQICIITQTGEVLEQRIATRRHPHFLDAKRVSATRTVVPS